MTVRERRILVSECVQEVSTFNPVPSEARRLRYPDRR